MDNIREFIEANVISADVSYRGGTVNVNVAELFPEVSNPVMGAYQNYLGGGIAGRIIGAAMFNPEEELSAEDQVKFEEVKAEIVKYFFELNGGGGDDYMQENYSSLEFNQNLPESGY
jgi:VIT1/CCC1 family predicted Fe2+/Mn2+ transporter